MVFTRSMKRNREQQESVGNQISRRGQRPQEISYDPMEILEATSSSIRRQAIGGVIADAPIAKRKKRIMNLGTENYPIVIGLSPDSDNCVDCSNDIQIMDNPNGNTLGLADDKLKLNKICDNLTCSICLEIIHKCVSIFPCLHKFCAGCLSDWIKMRKSCPKCRNHINDVNDIAQDVTIDNIIVVFLEQYPAHCRAASELEELDRKDEITNRAFRRNGKRGSRLPVFNGVNTVRSFRGRIYDIVFS
ncbi:unnamed protein product [Dracunculus medinensis]|uniref:RING-type domain-containing protein n=1 Tax=Dracunculus medinensis TaxID=318479 RepID=A0A0N4U1S9_DRAME|nr:unnamed protein product [Dracunculus medinensis]